MRSRFMNFLFQQMRCNVLTDDQGRVPASYTVDLLSRFPLRRLGELIILVCQFAQFKEVDRAFDAVPTILYCSDYICVHDGPRSLTLGWESTSRLRWGLR